jgi:hypothetical protein
VDGARLRRAVIPRQMTYSGSNLDIISGLTAIVVATVAARGWRRAGCSPAGMCWDRCCCLTSS